MSDANARILKAIGIKTEHQCSDSKLEMPIASNITSRPLWVGAALFFLSLAYYTYTSINFPILFNLDNVNNFAATKYIAKHHKLPIIEAGDSAIYFSESGTTRLSRPPFTYIVSAIVFNLTEGIVNDSTVRLRLGSPVIAAAAVAVIFTGFWFAFSHLGLALAGATIVGLLPRFVFLASCNNDDIGAILSVSFVFTAFIALVKYGFQTRIIIVLAIAFGLLLQTKYTAWLTLPWFGIYGLVLLRTKWHKLLRLTPLLLVACIVSGGWWVIFNMVNYGANDPSGARHIEQVQSAILNVEPNRQGYYYRGIEFIDLVQNKDQFLTRSFKSLIGYLEWLDLEMGFAAYFFYGSIFLIGIIGLIFCSRNEFKRESYLDLLAFVLVVGQCWFFVHHNLVREVQPQGRYVLPVIMPLVYLFLRTLLRVPDDMMGLRFPGIELKFHSMAATAILSVCLLVYANTLTQFITPSFVQQPFNTSINNRKAVDLGTEVGIRSTSAIEYEFDNQALKLYRTGAETPTIEFEPDFCRVLPINALLIIKLSSPEKGGFHLRFDRNGAGTFETVYWHSFPAGESVAVLPVKAENCTGVELTLGRKTESLTLESLQIGELRIHQHGAPI